MQLEAVGFGRLFFTGGRYSRDLFFNPVPTSIAEDYDVLRRHGLTLEEYQHNFFKMSEVERGLKAICLEEHPYGVELQELFQI